jgi:hypothetical protein
MNEALRKLILNAIALAMGVATFVLNLMGTLEGKTAVTLLSIGLSSLALAQFKDK